MSRIEINLSIIDFIRIIIIQGFVWPSGRNLSAYEENIVFFNKTIEKNKYMKCFTIQMYNTEENENIELKIEPVNCGQPATFICRFGK